MGERKLVTDEEVEAYISRPRRPPRKASGGRGAIMELVALCVPRDDPFTDRNIRGLGGLKEERRRLRAEEHPPSPVRVIMRNGVLVDPPPAPEPATPAPPESTAPSRAAAWMARKVAAGCCRRCGQPRGEEGTEAYCRGCADFVSTRMKDRRREWTPEDKARVNEVNKARRKRLIADGKCRKCGKVRDTGLSALCGACSEKGRAHRKAARERRRAP